jgi:hypothetical protein
MIAPCRCTGCRKMAIYFGWQEGLLWLLHWPELAEEAKDLGFATSRARSLEWLTS